MIFESSEDQWRTGGILSGDSWKEERVVEVSQKYYEWTDSLTPKPNDGKAFFGRDAMANYITMPTKEYIQ